MNPVTYALEAPAPTMAMSSAVIPPTLNDTAAIRNPPQPITAQENTDSLGSFFCSARIANNPNAAPVPSAESITPYCALDPSTSSANS